MQVSGFWLNIQMNKKPHTNQAQQPPKSKSRKISTTQHVSLKRPYRLVQRYGSTKI